MATTKIKSISSSPVNVIDYVTMNKGWIDEFGEEIKGVNDSISYAKNNKTGEVVFHTLTSHYNCSPGKEIRDFNHDIYSGKGSHYNGIRAKDGKEVVCYHLIQSFDGYEVNPQTANEIGLKLAKEMFKNHSVVVSTHTNTQNVHNHIVLCAWDKDGYKYNDCNDTYLAIRWASDRLCEQYNLSVLENTRDGMRKYYTDKNGKRRSVEVTERKKALWKDFKDGKAPIAKANDYRNSDSFKTQAAYEQSNRETIKEDIDLLLPYVSSYSELIDRLRDAGYMIKDKKVNGDYRQHVTFQAPGQQKGTRDYKLGDGVFYTRESLKNYIYGLVASRTAEGCDLSDVFYKTEAAGGVKDTHVANARLTQNNVFEAKVKKDMEEAISSLEGFKGIPAHKSREERLISQIKENIQTVSFIESRKLHSYEQINGLYKAAYATYNKALGEMYVLKKEVAQLEDVIMLKSKIDALESRLIAEKPEYEDLVSDEALLSLYRRQYEKSGLGTPDGEAVVSKKIELYKAKIKEAKLQVEKGKTELAGYEQCVRTLDRIDRKHGTRNEQAMKEFYFTRAQGHNGYNAHNRKSDNAEQLRNMER